MTTIYSSSFVGRARRSLHVPIAASNRWPIPSVTGVLAVVLICMSIGFVGCGGDEAATGVGGADGATVDGGPQSDGGKIDSGAVDSAATDTGSAPTACSDASVCDDKLACTEDRCTQPGKVCSWQVKADFCLIGKVCYAKGAKNPTNPCQHCAPEKGTSSWSATADKVSCEDGDACTLEGICTAGKCVAAPLVCGDNNPCTDDVCKGGKGGKGCVYTPITMSPTTMSTGVSCSDDDACTTDDACAEGTCLGKAVSCDDDESCTTDACDLQTGCTHTDAKASCSDDDACTEDDACLLGACKSGLKANCDDGNACTIDVCKSAVGCVHLPTQSPCCTGQTSICDDGNPCTTDLCDPKTSGCSKKLNKAVCNDGDACTAKDTCVKGACSGKVADCDDGNSCTTDACDKNKGCVHAATNAGKACDDGDACSKKDTCNKGKCIGVGSCACTPKFAPAAGKITDLKIGKGGVPGEGIDLDNDASTCAPKSSCKGGIDNALGAIAGLVNGQLDKPVQSGSIMLLVEFVDFKQGAVELAIHQGQLDPANKKCNFQKQTCKYWASRSLIDPITCARKASLKGTLIGTKLKVGGKGSNFPLALPLQDGVNLNLTIYDLQLVGTVTTKNGKFTGMKVILAGAVLKKNLEQAIDALPDKGLPIPKATIKSILASTVDVDMDVDGDGTPEASSIALKLTGIAAQITGAK